MSATTTDPLAPSNFNRSVEASHKISMDEVDADYQQDIGLVIARLYVKKYTMREISNKVGIKLRDVSNVLRNDWGFVR